MSPHGFRDGHAVQLRACGTAGTAGQVYFDCNFVAFLYNIGNSTESIEKILNLGFDGSGIIAVGWSIDSLSDGNLGKI